MENGRKISLHFVVVNYKNVLKALLFSLTIYFIQIRKPLVEKKRRDRMNNSLAQLKSLLAVNIKQNVSIIP